MGTWTSASLCRRPLLVQKVPQSQPFCRLRAPVCGRSCAPSSVRLTFLGTDACPAGGGVVVATGVVACSAVADALYGQRSSDRFHPPEMGLVGFRFRLGLGRGGGAGRGKCVGLGRFDEFVEMPILLGTLAAADPRRIAYHDLLKMETRECNPLVIRSHRVRSWIFPPAGRWSSRARRQRSTHGFTWRFWHIGRPSVFVLI